MILRAIIIYIFLNEAEQDMKNSAGQGGCYPTKPKAEVDNTLLNLQNSSYPTQPHSIIANYDYSVRGVIHAISA